MCRHYIKVIRSERTSRGPIRQVWGYSVGLFYNIGTKLGYPIGMFYANGKEINALVPSYRLATTFLFHTQNLISYWFGETRRRIEVDMCSPFPLPLALAPGYQCAFVPLVHEFNFGCWLGCSLVCDQPAVMINIALNAFSPIISPLFRKFTPHINTPVFSPCSPLQYSS